MVRSFKELVALPTADWNEPDVRACLEQNRTPPTDFLVKFWLWNPDKTNSKWSDDYTEARDAIYDVYESECAKVGLDPLKAHQDDPDAFRTVRFAVENTIRTDKGRLGALFKDRWGDSPPKWWSAHAFTKNDRKVKPDPNCVFQKLLLYIKNHKNYAAQERARRETMRKSGTTNASTLANTTSMPAATSLDFPSRDASFERNRPASHPHLQEEGPMPDDFLSKPAAGPPCSGAQMTSNSTIPEDTRLSVIEVFENPLTKDLVVRPLKDVTVGSLVEVENIGGTNGMSIRRFERSCGYSLRLSGSSLYWIEPTGEHWASQISNDIDLTASICRLYECCTESQTSSINLFIARSAALIDTASRDSEQPVPFW